MYKAGENSDNQSDTESVGSERVAFSGPIGERVAFSGPLSGPMSGPLNKRGRKSARFSVPESTNIGGGSDEPYVEITLDVRDDSVAVHSVKPAGGAEHEDPEVTLLAKTLEKRSSFGSSIIRSASSRIKQVSQELRRLASISKRPAPGRFDRTKSVAANALKGLKFISKTDGGSGWAAIEKRFEELAVNGTLPRSAFGQCIGMKESKEFAGELFDALSRRRNITGNSITKSELEEFWEHISDRSSNSRVQTFFDMVDKDADGRITEEEVKDIISVSASANRLSNIQARAEEYAALIMEELDPDNIGYIEIHDLEMLLQTIRGTTTNRRKLRRMLKPTKESNPILRWYQDTKYFIQDNWKRVLLVALWLGIVSGLFAYKFVQYRNRAAFDVMGYCVSTAKGAAETLKFNMALILLPVCRNTITWLRNKTKLGVVVPFDDNLNFHKVIAVGIAIGVGLHAGSHLTCDFPRLLHATEEEYEPMKPFFGEQPENYWRFVKGTEAWTGIVMVVLMAIAFTLATPWLRRNRLNLPRIFKTLTGFNAFWYSHHLFVIVYALLIVHGYYLYLTKEWYKKTTWMYIAIPVLLYGCERLIRAFRSGIKPVKILKVAIYPGNVLALYMLKPQGFRYQSGQYIFVNCAAVSPFEWHPFYITSAPRDAYLSVHIRTLGDWTSQLRTVLSEVCQPPTGGKMLYPQKGGLLRADQLRASIFPRVLIDGPYGAPAQEYKKYEVVLLVGLGIGATPLISVVKDIVVNMKTQEEEEDELEKDTRSSKKSGGFKTRKTYFYWVTREQGSFDWFKDVMNEVAESDQNGAIELHNYCTNIYKEGDARSALIEMVQWLNHAKNGVDIVSGTRVKSHFAKPNWREVYKRIALNHPDQRVGQFLISIIFSLH